MRQKIGILCLALTLGAVIPANGQDKESLVYADFERAENGRGVSARGGYIWLYAYQANQQALTQVGGLANVTPPAPELVRLKPDDPNHAAAFDYVFAAPNLFAGAGLEVFGQPRGDKSLVADDVSGYQFIQLDVYATGPTSIRVEIVSRDHGIELPLGYPQSVFKVKPGLNTYRLKLGSFRQPFWAQKVNMKNLLKNLTSVTVAAFCEQCSAAKGTVVVDNISFVN